MRKITCVLVLALPLLMACCKSIPKDKEKDKTEEGPMVGSDKDAHGCIGSAGYMWSEVLGECVRPWEKGVTLTGIDRSSDNVVVIFSKDSLKAELILPDGNHILLDRRKAAKGWVWNVEDDDTYNLMPMGNDWKVERRGKTLYKAK